MQQYLDLCRQVLDHGVQKSNRTGVDTIGIQGAMMKFDLADGFPAMTTKQLYWKSCFAEMLGFLRGYTNAEQFRELGCKVWDANANENKQWLNNPAREGEDDLGVIYGAQARHFTGYSRTGGGPVQVDQLRKVVDDLRQGIDNRREIVTHWNPAELNMMALPPCHLLYQFGIEDGRLNMCMYQRSCDMPLGVPFNIAGYAWLLSVIAHISGLKPGVFTHFLWDVHIYVNQIDDMERQLLRKPHELPTLRINHRVSTLSALEGWVTVGDFDLEGYNPEPAIDYAFSV